LNLTSAEILKVTLELAFPPTNRDRNTRRNRARWIQQPIKLGKEFTKSVNESALFLCLCHTNDLLWDNTQTITPSINMITYLSTQKTKSFVPKL
jgi:hypothetical protein